MNSDAYAKTTVDICNIIKSAKVSIEEANEILEHVKENILKYSGAFYGTEIKFEDAAD